MPSTRPENSALHRKCFAMRWQVSVRHQWGVIRVFAGDHHASKIGRYKGECGSDGFCISAPTNSVLVGCFLHPCLPYSRPSMFLEKGAWEGCAGRELRGIPIGRRIAWDGDRSGSGRQSSQGEVLLTSETYVYERSNVSGMYGFQRHAMRANQAAELKGET
jgi:hypothetical protein